MCKKLLTNCTMSNYNKYSGEKCVQKTAKAERRITMKKKLFAIAAIALLSAMCLSLFAACTTDVDGKTFVYDSYEIELNEYGKETADVMGYDDDEFIDFMMENETIVSDLVELGSSIEYSFKDGKCTAKAAGQVPSTVDYELDGKNITFDGVPAAENVATLTVSGSKLIMEASFSDIGTVKVIFKQK